LSRLERQGVHGVAKSGESVTKKKEIFHSESLEAGLDLLEDVDEIDVEDADAVVLGAEAR
jgi:hypothetical protein